MHLRLLGIDPVSSGIVRAVDITCALGSSGSENVSLGICLVNMPGNDRGDTSRQNDFQTQDSVPGQIPVQ